MSGVQVEADFLKPLPLRELLKVGKDSWRKFYDLIRSFPRAILSSLAYERQSIDQWRPFSSLNYQPQRLLSFKLTCLFANAKLIGIFH